jgi:predicted deacylase
MIADGDRHGAKRRAKRRRKERDDEPGRATRRAKPFRIAGWRIEPGTVRTLEIRLGELYNQSPIGMRTVIVHGRRAGPRLWISGGVHGDELAGIVAVRQVLTAFDPEALVGTLIAIPCVNELGALHCSREFPDGRDLNRCFPGSRTGTLASRIASAFLREVVSKCTHGVDVHTAGGHRDNLPQIRANLNDPETNRLARRFGTPIVLHSTLRDGSLREAASELGIPTLLFEGGKPLRHEPHVVDSAANGILRVMTELGMIDGPAPPARPPLVSWSSSWVRTPRSGYFVPLVELGDHVRERQPVAVVALRVHEDLQPRRVEVRAVKPGIVIGLQRLPLVHVGDPLVHIADVSPRRERRRRQRQREESADA